MTDATPPIFPAPFSVAPRYRVACCDVAGYEGFCVEARSNLTLAERDGFLRDWGAVWGYHAAYLDRPAEERDPHDTPRRRMNVLLAPYIRAWNATGIVAATGDEAPLPAPAEGGPDVLDLIEPPMREWIVETIGNGYVTGKGISFPSSGPSAPGSGTAGDTTTDPS